MNFRDGFMHVVHLPSVDSLFKFRNELNILHVSCKVVDVITAVDAMHVKQTSETIVKSTIKLASSNMASTGFDGPDSHDLEQNMRLVLTAGPLDSFEKLHQDEAIHNVTRGRRFFITESGKYGVGPDSIENGDIICIIAGCYLSNVLCKEEDYCLPVGEVSDKFARVSAKYLLTGVVEKLAQRKIAEDDLVPWQEVETH